MPVRGEAVRNRERTRRLAVERRRAWACTGECARHVEVRHAGDREVRRIRVRLSSDLAHKPKLHVVNRIAQNRALYLHPAAPLRENSYLVRPCRAFKRHRRLRVRRAGRIVHTRDDVAIAAAHDHSRRGDGDPRRSVRLVHALAAALRLPVEQPRVSLPQRRHLPPLRVTCAVAGVAAAPHIVAACAFDGAAVPGYRADRHADVGTARNVPAALVPLKIDVDRPLDLEIVAWPYSATRPQQPQSLRR